MGVPGLWRILDIASSPLNLSNCSGLRVAIDINSHVNKVLHGNHGGNWLFYIMKDLFSIIHYNIKIVIVFQGKKPVAKMFSTLLGEENDDLSYSRALSALMRASADIAPSQNVVDVLEEKGPIATKTEEEIKKSSPKKNVVEIKKDLDPLQYSLDQLNKVSTKSRPKQVAAIIRPQASQPFMILDKKVNVPKVSSDDFETPQITMESPKKKAELKSKYLDALKEIIEKEKKEEPEAKIEEKKEEKFDPISLEPADNPYLAPTENYVTGEHVRALKKLFDVLDIPYLVAPEEAAAECARLELQGVVDAVASDDNNAVLFGSKWLIRNIFMKPHSITLKSLDEIGLTRRRLVNMAMMIDGDYNSNIRRRLFTVGPIRGLEILSLFPQEKLGLFQFKEWWIRVVNHKGAEPDPVLAHFAKSKWLSKLIVPADFPPENLMNSFLAPTISNAKVNMHSPKFVVKDVVEYVVENSVARRKLIEDIVTAFSSRVSTFYDSIILMKWIVNDVNIPENMKVYIETISNYDREHKINFISDSDDDNEKEETAKNESEGEEKNKNTSPLIVLTPELKLEMRKKAALMRREDAKITESTDESSDEMSSVVMPPSFHSIDFISSDSESMPQSQGDDKNDKDEENDVKEEIKDSDDFEDVSEKEEEKKEKESDGFEDVENDENESKVKEDQIQLNIQSPEMLNLFLNEILKIKEEEEKEKKESKETEEDEDEDSIVSE